MAKRVGILGSGVVGQVLAGGFLKYGYEVMIGTRNPDKLKNWLEEAGRKAKVDSFAEAAGFGDLIVLAVKGSVAGNVLKQAGVSNLEGKTIIDACNPIADLPPENGVLKFFTDTNESLMEILQKQFTEANFVKAFSCVGNALMVNPSFKEGKPTMFICGNDSSAKKEVKEILALFGWEWEDMGEAEAARAIEPLCVLWCIPGFLKNEWMHAFKLLKA